MADSSSEPDWEPGLTASYSDEGMDAALEVNVSNCATTVVTANEIVNGES